MRPLKDEDADTADAREFADLAALRAAISSLPSSDLHM